MCFYGLFAQYLTSSAAAVPVAYGERGEGGTETVVEKERIKGGGSDRKAERLEKDEKKS